MITKKAYGYAQAAREEKVSTLEALKYSKLAALDLAVKIPEWQTKAAPQKDGAKGYKMTFELYWTLRILAFAFSAGICVGGLLGYYIGKKTK